MSAYVVGVDLGGTYTKMAAITEAGEFVGEPETFPTDAASGPESILSRLTAAIRTFPRRLGGASLMGIGLSVPGVLSDDGRILTAANLQKLENFPLQPELRRLLLLPIVMQNDANAAAVGERWRGAAIDSCSFMFLTIGTGIGCGLVLNGKVWSGDTGKGGEFGHIVIEPRGLRCGCGGVGCVELYASATALKRMALEYARTDANGLISRHTGGSDDELVPAIFQAFRVGDPIAQLILGVFVTSLATAMVTAMNLLDVTTFVIGGGVSSAFEIFGPSLRAEVVQRSWGIHRGNVNIKPAECGPNAGLLGAARLAWEAARQQC